MNKSFQQSDVNNYKVVDMTKVLARLKLFFDIKTDTDLANFLAVKQPTISNWQRRNTIDMECIISKCNNSLMNLDWLLTGRGSMYRSEGGAVQSVNGNGNTSVQGSERVKVEQAPQATQSVSELQKCKEEVERLHERLKEANETAKTAMEAVKLLANKNV